MDVAVVSHAHLSLFSQLQSFDFFFGRTLALQGPACLLVVVRFSSPSDLARHDGSSDFWRSLVLLFLPLCNRLGPWREGPLGELRRSGGSSKVCWSCSVRGWWRHTGNRVSVIGAKKVFFLRLKSSSLCNGGSLEWDGRFSLRVNTEPIYKKSPNELHLDLMKRRI